MGGLISQERNGALDHPLIGRMGPIGLTGGLAPVPFTVLLTGGLAPVPFTVLLTGGLAPVPFTGVAIGG